MKRIKLSNAGYALVDDEDFDRLRGFAWHQTKNGYAARSVWADNSNKKVYMHRMILETPEGLDTDHIDYNKLNNQKANLRPASRSNNMANVRKARNKASQYKGVSKYNRPNLKKPWVAYIKQDYKMVNLGYFETELEAATAYNNKAVELFGTHAHLNQL